MRKLPVGHVMLGMVAEPWAMRRQLFPVLSLPAASMMAVIMLRYLFAPTEFNAWLAWGLYSLAGAWFAVRCHRAVLLGPARAWPEGRLPWGWRETWFTGTVFLIYLCSFIVIPVLSTPVGIVLGLLFPGQSAPHLVGLLLAAWLPQMWVFGRIGMVLPAIAVDRPLSLRRAWVLSRGNGWRLMWLVGLVPLVLSALPGLLWREGATVVEQAALTLLTIPLLVIEVAALSLGYRHLAMPSESGCVEA